jgi:RNA polymerase sigma factor (sigma-70 family)
MTALPASLDLLLTAPAADSASPDIEQEKIRAAQVGDMAAFEWIVREHEARVAGFCARWLRCAEDTREVCQDVFVRAWQALPEFECRARLSTWLYQIALNLCRDRARSRGTRQREHTTGLDDMEHAPACPKPCPGTRAELRGELDKLNRGLDALPEKERAALILVTIEGLSQRDCAEVLGCTVRGVEGRVHRARQELMRWWDENS